jgi:transposase
VVDYETYCRIRDHLVRQQLTVAQTARALGLDTRTVAKWADVEQFRARKAVPRASKLDAFKGQIVRWLDAHPYSAQQIYQRLAEAGYAGGITIVKDYVHCIRPRRQPAFLKLDFEPGECAQVDWGLRRARHRPHYAEFPHMPSERSARSSSLDLGCRSSEETRHSFLHYRLFRNVSNASSGR